MRGSTLQRSALWLVVAGALFVPVFPDPPLQSGCYLQRITTTSARVLEIAPEPTRLALVWTAADGSSGKLPLSEPCRRHEFVLEGLEPGMRYEYEVRDAAGQRVGGGAFSAASDRDDAPYRFAVVGDSGKVPWWVWLQNNPWCWFMARYELLGTRYWPSQVAEQIAADQPDLVLHVGDVVYPYGRYDHYGAALFRPFADVLRNAAFYPVLGNHDTYNDDGRQLVANFSLPVNPVTGDERFYAFSRGPVRFAALDLNRRPLEPAGPELEFLYGAFADSTEPWRIVFAHFPILSASRHGDRPDLIAHLLPALLELRVDVAFFGHDHNYQRFGDETAPSGKSVVMIVTGGGGKSLYDLHVHPQVRQTYHGYHYTRVDVLGGTLRIAAVAADGTVVDRVELTLRQRLAQRPGFDPEHNARDRRALPLL